MDFKKPPNYGYHLHATLAEQSTYRLFPVSSSSAEYSVISSLLNGVADVKSVEQIMNPSLWDRFKMTRKEMLKSKTTDAKLLADFGLSEMEIAEAMAYSRNFEQNIQVAHVPYDPNMALLFHCTRNRNNVEAILSQGLDERLGNVGGLLGRGIYFADNPMKSMSYDGCNVIFLFAVLLGDCLCMDDKTDRFVREPKKRDDQKRHLNDLAFDSIAGKPDGYNSEFVIYNRYGLCDDL